jgi:ring-1,2-phenylacetyl-CoA epoxidase subunit PaaC
VAVDPAQLRPEFDEAMSQVLEAATVTASTTTDVGPTSGGRGRHGDHGPELGEILAEMQELARALPGGAW